MSKSLIEFKKDLMVESNPSYKIDFLINQFVFEWILENKKKYDNVYIISASPDFFVKKIIEPLCLFDKVFGSEEINLKGTNKLNFILEKFGDNFIYIGNSNDDKIIFKHAKEALLITKSGLVNAK